MRATVGSVHGWATAARVLGRKQRTQVISPCLPRTPCAGWLSSPATDSSPGPLWLVGSRLVVVQSRCVCVCALALSLASAVQQQLTTRIRKHRNRQEISSGSAPGLPTRFCWAPVGKTWVSPSATFLRIHQPRSDKTSQRKLLPSPLLPVRHDVR